MEIKRTLIPPKTADQKPIEIFEYDERDDEPNGQKPYVSDSELSKIADAIEKSIKNTKDGDW